MANHALIIANGKFSDPDIVPLYSPVRDGERLKALLERPDVGGYDVALLCDKGLLTIRVAIEKFFQNAANTDLRLLFITGHGDRVGGGNHDQLYFMTADSNKKEGLAATSLSARYVNDERDKCKAQNKIMIFDTCHSGSHSKGYTNKGGGGFVTEDFGNARIKGWATIAAASATQAARESEIDGEFRSHFTHYMIKGIETGDADRENGGKITLGNLFAYVNDQLADNSPGQNPTIDLKGPLMDLMIAKNPCFVEVVLPPEVVSLLDSDDQGEVISGIFKLEKIAGSDAGLRPLAIDRLRILQHHKLSRVGLNATVVLQSLGMVIPPPPGAAAPIAEHAASPNILPSESNPPRPWLGLSTGQAAGLILALVFALLLIAVAMRWTGPVADEDVAKEWLGYRWRLSSETDCSKVSPFRIRDNMIGFQDLNGEVREWTEYQVERGGQSIVLGKSGRYRREGSTLYWAENGDTPSLTYERCR